MRRLLKKRLVTKPKREGGQPREGIARCTFEDTFLVSDIVYMRGWADVEIPRFYNPLTTVLITPDKTWEAMKTVAELRRQHNLSIPVNKDSLYKPIERRSRKFDQLVIPKLLPVALPFESKLKDTPSLKQPLLENRRAEVMDPLGRNFNALEQHLQLIRNEKAAKEEIGYQSKRKGAQPREEIARCIFEDRILMSDIVYVHGWADVEFLTFTTH